MSEYFELENEFNSIVEKAKIELKGDCPLSEDGAIIWASKRIAELEKQVEFKIKECQELSSACSRWKELALKGNE